MSTARPAGLLPLALIAAVLATLCDANHVDTATLRYPDPLFAGQAWWVFPGFLIAFLGMGMAYIGLTRLLDGHLDMRRSQSPGTLVRMVDNMMAFVIVYLLSGFASDRAETLSWVLYGGVLPRLIFTYERGWIVLLAVLLAVGGMFVEGLLTQFALVTYLRDDIFGVPYWLGGVYMHGAFALREGMRYFVYRQPAAARPLV